MSNVPWIQFNFATGAGNITILMNFIEVSLPIWRMVSKVEPPKDQPNGRPKGLFGCELPLLVGFFDGWTRDGSLRNDPLSPPQKNMHGGGRGFLLGKDRADL